MDPLFEKICSLQSLHAAWDRVRSNHGCRGSDGMTIEGFEKRLKDYLYELHIDLRTQSYHPYPLMRFAIPKKNSKEHRFLSIPTVRDRVAQASAYLSTRDVFDQEFESVSHAYRQGKGVDSAIINIRYWRDKGFRYAVDADIDDYFESVPHELLLDKLKQIIDDEQIISLFKKWIKAELYDGTRIWKSQKGIPQGSIVSPILANLYLDELDEILMSFDRKLVRYADDFIILSQTEEEAAENIELSDMVLEDLRLELNPSKTKIISFDEGFKFLGAVFIKNDIFKPFPHPKKHNHLIKLPPPLTLKRYLELRDQTE